MILVRRGKVMIKGWNSSKYLKLGRKQKDRTYYFMYSTHSCLIFEVSVFEHVEECCVVVSEDIMLEELGCTLLLIE